MDNYLIYFKNSYTLVPLVVFLALIFVFVDSKVNSYEYNKKVVLKTMISSSLIVFLSIYINNLKGTTTEDVLTGVAPF